MVIVLYPQETNWFYEQLAHRVGQELDRLEVPVSVLSSEAFVSGDQQSRDSDIVILISLSEILFALGGEEKVSLCLNRLRAFKRRILLTCDALSSHWFGSQFTPSGVVNEVFDLNVVPQSAEARAGGVPYCWIPEAFTHSELADLGVDRGERPIPWALIGHHTNARVNLVSELVEHFGSEGFLLMPSLKPYRRSNRGLEGPELLRVLKCTELYPWRSHHEFPHHECLRSQDAVRSGAAPAKIDPIHAAKFSEIPWVFESVESLGRAVERDGCAELYRLARTHLANFGPLGEHLMAALDR